MALSLLSNRSKIERKAIMENWTMNVSLKPKRSMGAVLWGGVFGKGSVDGGFGLFIMRSGVKETTIKQANRRNA
jgi:hypothetical protein